MSKCNVQQLATDAGCFFCLSPGERQAAKLALLCRIARSLNSSVSCNLNSLMANSSGFATLDAGMLDAIKAQLLCDISKGSGGGGGSTITITAPTDPDASNFLCAWITTCFSAHSCSVVTNCAPGVQLPLDATCASACGIKQSTVDAVTALVTALKAAGLWTLMDVIYPFVGGNASACSLNLKNPSLYQIQWGASGLSFAQAGVIADASGAGHGDSTFAPASAGGNFSLNSASMGVYFTSSSITQGWFCGMSNSLALNPANIGYLTLGPNFSYELNALVPASTPSTGFNGNIVASRTGAATAVIYQPDGSSTSSGFASNALDTDSLCFPGRNTGVGSGGTFDASCAGTYGFGFAGGGLTGAQVATLFGIVNTFIAAK